MVTKISLTTLVFLFPLISNISLCSQEMKWEVKDKIKKISKEIVQKMSDEEKAGQVIHIALPGKDIDEISSSEIKKIKPGGVILFGTNLGNAEEIRNFTDSLQDEAKKNKILPLFISTDQEGGRVVRVKKGVTDFPGAMAIGQTNNEQYGFDVGFITSYQLNKLGINVLLAPSLDINNNPENPVINTRSFGSDLNTVVKIATAYERGAREGGALPVIKHFPGHGDTNIDSHLGLPIIEKDMEQITNFELVPFKKSIEDGARAVMSAHIVYPKIDPKFPATLSKEILTGILREKLKFEGIIFTDAMEMDAISKNYKKEKRGILALLAGADIVLLTSWGKTTTEYYEMILDGIKKKEFIIGERDLLEEALIRQVSLKIEFGLLNSTSSNVTITDYDILEYLETRTSKIKEKMNFFKKQNIKDYNLKISMDSIRSLGGVFTPITPETALTYQFYLNRKNFQEEVKLIGLNLISEKRFLKLIKSNLHSKIVVESNNQVDLDKLSKLLKQSPDSEFILLHTGSPYLNFPNHSKLSVILSFSPTKASQTALIRRVFQSSPEEKVLPCNLNLKIKK